MSTKSKSLIPPGLAYIADNIVSKDNIIGASKAEGARWAKDLGLPKRADTIFFAGCGYQHSAGLESLMALVRKLDKSAIGAEASMSMAGFQKKLGVDLGGAYRKVFSKGGDEGGQVLRNAVKVLQKLGIDFGYLAEEEPCCGGPLHFIGLRSEFVKNAQATYKKLKSLGVKRIISIVPSCTYTLRTLFSECVDGYDIEVKHFLEVVADGIESRDLHFPREVKVTYHDSCQLARYLGLIEEPRRILKAIKGLELVETDWTKGEWATCCGGGGGFEAVFPELSGIIAKNRAQELVETGAQIIVTHCPGCVMQLKDGVKELKTNGVEVLDLAQVVAMAMEV
ncbi:(Fe-S)-binding protein [Chloroflexota bacterium]